MKNKELYQYYVIDRANRKKRVTIEDDMGEAFAEMMIPYEERTCKRFELLCKLETPSIQPFEKIVMVRTIANFPDCFADDEWEKIRKEHYIHELGYVSNLSPDYETTIRSGLLARKKEATECQIRMIDAIIGLCDKYLEEAKRLGRDDLVEIFTQIPRYGARNFREALQFFRILHFSLWLEGDYHNTIGRFDKYMYPYFKKDMDEGIYDEESALELIEDFFMSFNKDSDLYVGVQQGDNGQSMVLGGTDENGNDCFTLLSELCLKASRNLKLIDPKINLRVSSKTPIDVFEKGTELTKAGLGFPQYSNDDIVIPGLVRLGYDYDDAANYVVAACWEFIIPGVGNDIANIGAVNFPKIVDQVIRKKIHSSGSKALISELRKEIKRECDRIRKGIKNVWFVPSPFMDLLRKAKKYQNFGLHGCGIASAADALAAVDKYVFQEKIVSPERLLNALDSNFENDPELMHLLRFESPKMGTGSPEADYYGGIILDAFADALEGKKNCLGGVWRAGTGTAMYYLWHASELGATADGRRAGEPFGTNFSPSLFANIPGPITDIESFTSHDLKRTINGGPLTLEFASGIFNSDESIGKVAALIKYFIDRGGHQLQLNAVDPQAMRKAQENPELYRQLVVRIWGWSAYFVELDKCYQDHVLARQEYTV